MASEQFSLCWDNFHKNMSSGMNSLLESGDLVDVTLAVEGKFLKAHKMVLSVCSPYFKELFKTNPCQHPIVFMKDVSYVAISDLLQFMYQGEVQVSQDNLTTFIKTAEALQIKGLTGDGNGSTDADSEPVQEKPTRHIDESYKPSPRPKKQLPAPVVTTTPAVKRPRLSASSNDSQSAPIAIAKTEPSSTGVDSSSVQFKVEPYDLNQSVTIPDDGDDNFDENLDDNTVDDTEDYSMMEGEEPQAGTSTDGTGEGQERTTIYVENPKPGKHPKLIVDDHTFLRHRTQGTREGTTIRWRCSHVFKNKCKAVLYTTLQPRSTIRALYDHNHPSDLQKWDKLRMIPQEFRIIRSSRACKRGPVKNPSKFRGWKKKNPTNEVVAVEEALKDVKSVVVREVTVLEEDPLSRQNNEIAWHIEGQAEPIVIKVIEAAKVVNSEIMEVAEEGRDKQESDAKAHKESVLKLMDAIP
ncbi:protein tramtrack, beta isoform-like isoform X14 [Euwallacea similis]|uniref:protein tramtrack, beta isoform-like isoform X14 n=1 Tax=Euwallacea similis TaxID=1736056 RepID=UPI00344F747D